MSYTTTELHKFLGERLKISTLQRYARTGKIKAKNIGTRARPKYEVSEQEAISIRDQLDNGTWPKAGNPNPTGRPKSNGPLKDGVIHLACSKEECGLIAQLLSTTLRHDALIAVITKLYGLPKEFALADSASRILTMYNLIDMELNND